MFEVDENGIKECCRMTALETRAVPTKDFVIYCETCHKNRVLMWCWFCLCWHEKGRPYQGDRERIKNLRWVPERSTKS